ncbi:hypothetical protein [Helicobacter sp. MIT 01-3238]|uniref:hypothetical protein n=1 Tax=Helicobacter sp. MIT 01-3238 TaxID=398627 RepID=UPI000E1E6066|nr:hypothetical protein [Helicobacter sp. MIT 01-3238]RDU51978.1 hypothetical protein CQA40_08590 [Helicobacter sp. MIT 01-3238]
MKKVKKWGKSIKICNPIKKWSAKSLANALGFAFARLMKICVGYFGKKATPKFCHTHKRNIKNTKSHDKY